MLYIAARSVVSLLRQKINKGGQISLNIVDCAIVTGSLVAGYINFLHQSLKQPQAASSLKTASICFHRTVDSITGFHPV